MLKNCVFLKTHIQIFFFSVIICIIKVKINVDFSISEGSHSKISKTWFFFFSQILVCIVQTYFPMYMYFIYPWLHCCSILKYQAVPRFSRSIWGKWFVFCLTIALRKIIPYTMWIKGHCVAFSHALIKGIFHHHLQHKMGRIRTQQWVPECSILSIFTTFIVLWVKNKLARR